MKKTLVLYIFHIYNERVKNFFENSIFYDENLDFLVISNDRNNNLDCLPSYVMTFFRDNIGFDFGGWSDALLTNKLYDKYENFIFVNSSVIGPFLPENFEGKWTDIYIDGLQKNNVKLFGSTINTIEKPLTHSHVQSYIFSMDRITLLYLIDCGIFSNSHYTKSLYEAVWTKEVLMSLKVLENNWNIGSLLKCYDGVDFTFKSKRPEEYNIKFANDVMYPGFRNWFWYDNELIFIKGNR